MAAREEDVPSKRMPEQEESSPEAADQKADLAVPGTAEADVDGCSVYDDHYAIWNLNRMARLGLKSPEWIEEKKKEHYEHVALLHKVYADLEQEDDDGEVADEATMAEFDELCDNIFANVNLSGLNTAGGESCGMDAIGVFPWKSQTHGEDIDAAAAADDDDDWESSS